MSALKQEIKRVSSVAGYRPQITSVYFGGGTASLLKISEYEELLDTIRENYDLSACAELTFEGEVMSLKQSGYIEALAKSGVTRLSFGAQLTHTDARKALNLKPTMEDIASLVQRALPLFDEVALDYMFGWPGFDADATEADLRKLLDTCSPSTIECFRFEINDAMPDFVVELTKANIFQPDFHEYKLIYDRLVSVLAEYGYERRSYSLFSRRSVGRFKYYEAYYGWGKTGLIGFGCGAQSFLAGRMWGSTPDLHEYSEELARGALPYSTFVEYNEETKESVTWPRRGFIDIKCMSLYSIKQQSILDALIAGNLLVADGELLKIAPGSWAYVPALMHLLLPDHDAATFETWAGTRARERGLRSEMEIVNATV